jgi:hypothetical protein
MKLTLLILFVFVGQFVFSQNYIGKSKDQLLLTIPKDMPGFTQNSFGKSSDLNSTKFTDSKKDRTVIFFFDEKDICTYYKLIEDSDSYDKRVAEYNTKYKSVSKNNWSYQIEGKNYKIVIDQGDYIFTTIYTL